MQAWLLDWYRISYEPEMTPGMEHQMDQMAELSGVEFEIEFVTTMIRHHCQAIVKAAHCVDKAYHPEWH